MRLIVARGQTLYRNECNHCTYIIIYSTPSQSNGTTETAKRKYQFRVNQICRANRKILTVEWDAYRVQTLMNGIFLIYSNEFAADAVFVGGGGGCSSRPLSVVWLSYIFRHRIPNLESSGLCTYIPPLSRYLWARVERYLLLQTLLLSGHR